MQPVCGNKIVKPADGSPHRVHQRSTNLVTGIGFRTITFCAHEFLIAIVGEEESRMIMVAPAVVDASMRLQRSKSEWASQVISCFNAGAGLTGGPSGSFMNGIGDFVLSRMRFAACDECVKTPSSRTKKPHCHSADGRVRGFSTTRVAKTSGEKSDGKCSGSRSDVLFLSRQHGIRLCG